MTKNEQIRELALAICHGRVGGDTEICKKCWRNSSRCYYKKLALALYKAGYRKVMPECCEKCDYIICGGRRDESEGC